MKGAIGGELHVDGLTIRNGWVPEGEGGGIYLASASLTVSDSVFVGNVAQDGGGIYAWNGVVEVTDTRFEGNRARSAGGGAYLATATATLSRVSFDGNVTHGSGAGIALGGGVTTFTDVGFSANEAIETGGAPLAIYCLRCDLTALRTDISGHERTAVRADQGTMRFIDGHLHGNTGSPAVFALSSAGLALEGTRVVDNVGLSGVIDVQGVSTLTCDGAEISDNATNFLGIVKVLDRDARFVATACDFGEGADDNVGADVWTLGAGASYFYGDDTTVTCANYVCQ